MITIHEVLKLKRFNSFRLVAGAGGLERMVSKGGFIDHETAEEMRTLAYKGEMIFSNLPMIKDQPEKIAGFVEALIQAQTSCFAIKTKIFNEIPEDAIQIANKHNYPLFLFDDTYIEELILDIDGLVNTHKYLQKQVDILDKIMSNTLAPHNVRFEAYELNRSFKEHHLVCMIKPKAKSQLRLDIRSCQKLLDKEHALFPWKDGYLLIVSKHTDEIKLEPILELLKLNQNYTMGFSDVMNDLTQLGYALNQALTSLKFACYKDKSKVHYGDIGVFQVLLPLLDQPVVSDYYRKMIQTLESYDEKYQSGLLETAIAYINGDGDIKKASDILYQHQNTIRYRVRKIKDLLNLERLEGMQYESLAMAVHLHELNMNREKFNLL
ncbi:hypothetical protein EZV73_12490 [Acidaminobacter sp. JC074]|uniref:PucR family transcriptional regulator n=1 Tax=Acidaminobacter sp. JC074 TaxID=2530199 RepID=UPI001F0D7C8C|nr:PucR family transcriptional regulator [Acidaminobacter sp. JC074]MCH4888401.1 hypothetical protein [Acidaminobacter sp. JC074]